LPTVSQQDAQAIYIVDRPEAQQSVIVAGQVSPPRSDPDEVAISMMNTVLGGDFNARINMNLREDKGWSYGAQSLILDARGQRPFLVLAPVQSDKTIESVQEVAGELGGILADRPITEEEVERAVLSRTLTLPGGWETNFAVLNSIAQMEQFDLPEDYYDTLADRIRAMDREELAEAAERVVQPDRLIWVVVGDKAQIEEGLRGLGYGPVFEIDADGNVIGRLAS
jgi:zinc protease